MMSVGDIPVQGQQTYQTPGQGKETSFFDKAMPKPDSVNNDMNDGKGNESD